MVGSGSAIVGMCCGSIERDLANCEVVRFQGGGIWLEAIALRGK